MAAPALAPPGGALQQETPVILFGINPGQGNLAALRARAKELRDSLAEVYSTLSQSAHLLQWDAILQKFSVLNMQVMAVKEQLRGLLRQVIVHPRMVDSAGVANALPIQLASKLTPQLEADDALILSQAESHMAAAGIPPQAQYAQAERQIDDFNRLVSELTSPDGLLGAKGEARMSMRDTSRQISTRLDTLRALEAAAAAAADAGSTVSTGAAGVISGMRVKVGTTGGVRKAPGAAAGAGGSGSPVSQVSAGSSLTGGPASKRQKTEGVGLPQPGGIKTLDPVLMQLLPTDVAVQKTIK